MPHRSPVTVLCVATYLKGHEFIRECSRQGCRVLLLTVVSLSGADWPREAIDEFFYMPRDIAREDLSKAMSHVARSVSIDRIVALDDYAVETAAALREHLRDPGMGETTARYFRDKLAMRLRGRNHGIPVPEFVHVLNDDRMRTFTEAVPPPWIADADRHDLRHELRHHAGTRLGLGLPAGAAPDARLGRPALPLVQTPRMAVGANAKDWDEALR